MRMKLLLPFVISIVVIVIGTLYYFNRSTLLDAPFEPPVHEAEENIISGGEGREDVDAQDHGDIHASFAIYTRGVFRVFTASMYHELSPAAYITKDTPNVVTITRAGVTWQDFFDTLPFELTRECLRTGTGETYCTNDEYSLMFYRNGERNDNVLREMVADGDQLLITYDKEGSVVVFEQQQQIPEPNIVR